MTLEKIPIGNFIVHSNRGITVPNSLDDLLLNPKLHYGGLTTALAPVLSQGEGGVWVSTAGTEFERAHFREGNIERVPFDGRHINVTQVVLPEADYESFYKGFCDPFWFLMHLTEKFYDMEGLAFPQPTLPNEYFEAYRRVNEAHARAALRLAKDKNGTVILNSHDYHLMLFAKNVRDLSSEFEVDPDRLVMFQFMHTPIPPHENLREIYKGGHALESTLKSLFDGLLQDHLVLTQTDTFNENLAEIYRMLGYGVRREGFYYRVTSANRTSAFLIPNPIGIDTGRTVELAHADPALLNSYKFTDAGTEIGLYELIKKYRDKGYLVGGSIERLDPTKGLLPRLDSLESYLEGFEENGEIPKLIYIGFWPTSRNGTIHVLAEEKIKRINAIGREKFGHDVIFRGRDEYGKPKSINSDHTPAAMRLFDFFTVTPLDDGFNLTAIEYIAAQSTRDPGERGFLLLGNCGFRRELDRHHLGFEGEGGVVRLDAPSSTFNGFNRLSQLPGISDRLVEMMKEYDVRRWFAKNLEYLSGVTRPFEVVF